MSQSFPHLHWLDGERVERVEREGVKGERTELERELRRLEAVGEDDEDEEGKREPEGKCVVLVCGYIIITVRLVLCVTAPDPLVGFSLNDELAMEKIKRETIFSC